MIIYQHASACYRASCNPFILANTANCSRSCRFVGIGTNTDQLRNADVVIWDATHDAPKARSIKQSHQRYIGFFWESPSVYRDIQKQDLMSVFDFEYSYRRAAHYSEMTMMTDTTGDFSHIRDWRPRSFSEKRRNVMITAWISNCGTHTNRRISVLEELVRYGITARNFGRCNVVGGSRAAQVHARSWSETVSKFYSSATGRSRIPSAKSHGRDNLYEGGASLFYFAAENSNCEDYHTEKVWMGFHSGALPIYFGWSPTARQAFPQDSVIFADDYPSVRALATYLHELARNETAYAAYFTWRQRPFPSVMLDNIQNGLTARTDGAMCRICQHLHDHFNASDRGFVAQSSALCQ